MARSRGGRRPRGRPCRLGGHVRLRRSAAHLEKEHEAASVRSAATTTSRPLRAMVRSLARGMPRFPGGIRFPAVARGQVHFTSGQVALRSCPGTSVPPRKQRSRVKTRRLWIGGRLYQVHPGRSVGGQFEFGPPAQQPEAGQQTMTSGDEHSLDGARRNRPMRPYRPDRGGQAARVLGPSSQHSP